MENEFFDYIVIGSGFGGSVAALRLVEKGYRVCLIEKGKRTAEKDFDTTFMQPQNNLWAPQFRFFGCTQISTFRGVTIAHGVGLGGGSLVYANVLLEPAPSVYEALENAGFANARVSLQKHFGEVRATLRAQRGQSHSNVDTGLKAAADTFGEDCRHHTLDIAVELDGTKETGCRQCGACMAGCQFGSKNTLDKTYIRKAEKLGLKVFTTTLCEGIERSESGLYSVSCRRKTEAKRFKVSCSNVIVAAGVVGTLRLLLYCRDVAKTLPHLSPTLGDRVGTNGETLFTLTARASNTDFSAGPAISTGVTFAAGHRMELARLPEIFKMLRYCTVPVTEGTLWIRALFATLFFPLIHPKDFFTTRFGKSWHKRTLLYLGMSHDSSPSLSFKMRRNVLTLFKARLQAIKSKPEIESSSIHERFARHIAKVTNCVLQAPPFRQIRPVTVHPLGGCSMGRNKDEGVVDFLGRVYGYEGLYVLDASIVPSNLGSNPALTIAAIAEHSMEHIAHRNTAATESSRAS